MTACRWIISDLSSTSRSSTAPSRDDQGQLGQQNMFVHIAMAISGIVMKLKLHEVANLFYLGYVIDNVLKKWGIREKG